MFCIGSTLCARLRVFAKIQQLLRATLIGWRLRHPPTLQSARGLWTQPRPATEADLAAFKEGSIEVRETAEEPVISKTARVVEEVVVGKEATERTETIDDIVRRTEVEVDRGNEPERETSERTQPVPPRTERRPS